ncbi:hypothetical protein M422DRAFT_33592, partial [Sphaerobolus stellatus SS14]
ARDINVQHNQETLKRLSNQNPFLYVDLKCQDTTLAYAWCAPLRAEHPQYEEPNLNSGRGSLVLNHHDQSSAEPCSKWRTELVHHASKPKQ